MKEKTGYKVDEDGKKGLPCASLSLFPPQPLLYAVQYMRGGYKGSKKNRFPIYKGFKSAAQ
jgi:hypothetical protein